ncbi:PDDEXK nuclease domain-containing protein [Cellulomonas endometrii]|uniref:PDDEXK nuclease domain-containing protein n=1 Tax=Cellulomonas endometrii TaxID=3036301 RepID=UPI0024ADA7E9|nr:PDDEXK nuclease domain-containing protein [Cellulomonas endometrii]
METHGDAPVEPAGYGDLLEQLKARVRSAQLRAVRAANTEVLRLYWSIGSDILERQRTAGWGGKVVDRLAADLRREFPEMRGWSRSNLMYMRRAAAVWPSEPEFVQQPVGRLPWGHVTVLLDRLPTREDRDWYAARAADQGWSRAVLEHHIGGDLRGAVGSAPTNFDQVLDPADSDLARQLVKDPYVFEHLALVRTSRERDVEQALMDRLQDTLMELGRGMSLVGRQLRLQLGDGDEFVIDLLLFHVEQLRYVVVELKVGPFTPAHLGQLGAYVAAVDGELRRPAVHAPTVGILLCTGKGGAAVRYALASTAAPVAVADYQGLPEDARAALPSADELQAVVDAELRR